MERKISPDDESRMVGAIEKAATLASCKDNCDVNKVLADCLLEKHVDSRFAKTASAAFNRRLTVLKFQKTDDAHRADSFGLSDSDSVYEMMGGVPDGQRKVASEEVVGVFKMELVTPTELVKVASVESKPVNLKYEDRVTIPVFERHLESMLDKHASEFMKNMGELKMLEDAIERRKKEVAGELSKAASFELSTLYSVYGDRFEKAFGGMLPKGMKLTKFASVVPPETPLSEKVAKLLDDIDLYADCNDMMCDYKQYLGEFAKSAAEVSKVMHKKAVGGSTFAGITVRSLPAMTLSAINAADSVRTRINEGLDNNFSNAKAFFDAVGPYSMSPSEVLSSEFLTRDRYHDRMLASSDMSADPMFAPYPAIQTFMATQKAMDLDPSMESPDKRELLRSEVADLLLSNGRFGKNDIAATTTILQNLGKAKDSVYSIANDAVNSLESKSGPGAVELTSPLGVLNKELGISGKDLIGKAVEENTKALEQEAKEEASKRDAEAKKYVEDSRRKENEQRQAILDRQREEEQRYRKERDEKLDERWNTQETNRNTEAMARASAEKTKAEAKQLEEENKKNQLQQAGDRATAKAVAERVKALREYAKDLGLHRTRYSNGGKVIVLYEDPGASGTAYTLDQIAQMYDDETKNIKA